MKVLFYTNIPTPYRLDFFNLLGQHVELTAVFTQHRSENVGWIQGREHIRNFQAIFLCDENGGCACGRGLKKIYPNAVRYALGNWDAIFVTNYYSPTEVLLIRSLKNRRIPYILEVDGGFIRDEGALKRLLKKYLISGAQYYLSTGAQTDSYLSYYGADGTRLRRYPLSSVFADEISGSPAGAEEKAVLRKALGLPDGPLVLFVGQLIHRKGVDILAEAAGQLPDVRFCVVGNGDASVYKAPGNVLFAGQKSKAELAQYYRAADLFVLPTREDIWGLVVVEAAAKGLPVITTDRCIAGLEMLDQRYIIPAADAASLTRKADELLSDPEALRTAAEKSLAAARRYTIETMAETHLAFLSEL